MNAVDLMLLTAEPKGIEVVWQWIQDHAEIIKATLRAIVEISALAVVFYYMFNYLQRSRGWPVVVGFMLLLALYSMITALELNVLRSLLNQLFLFTTVAILIIFQPELRRLLAVLGNLPLFAANEESPLDVDAVVQATDRLSRKRVGSIMAIEQLVDIHQETQSGVLIDSALTAEMLDSIFMPQSPLHDGGVIIRGDRIMYASCIFPLTRRIDVNRTLGTRHRAAIGLSEETDAIVVIVSEETGDISYCHNGALYSKVELKQLKDFLLEMLKAEVKPEETRPWLARAKDSLRDIADMIEKKLRPKEKTK